MLEPERNDSPSYRMSSQSNRCGIAYPNGAKFCTVIRPSLAPHNQAIGELADITGADIGINAAINPAPLVAVLDHMSRRDA